METLHALRPTLVNHLYSTVLPRKKLYISLVRSQLIYGSQIWRPLQLKDINLIESLQRRATKYILNDYDSDYRSRLFKLHLLPVSMLLEVNDICFFVKSLKHISSNNSFDVSKYLFQPQSNQIKKLQKASPAFHQTRQRQTILF